MPRAKADNKPRGRMSSYAYFVQTCREEHRKKHPEESIAFAAFSKKCSDRWKVMSEKEKKRFVEMADRDKVRYEAEMKHYVPPAGAGKTKSGRRKKDPNAPKRALSAFFWFCNDERPGIREANPGYTVGDVAKELGRRWGDVDEEAKKGYNAMAEKDRERYAKEMAAYKSGAMPAPAPAAEFDDDDDEDEDDE